LTLASWVHGREINLGAPFEMDSDCRGRRLQTRAALPALVEMAENSPQSAISQSGDRGRAQFMRPMVHLLALAPLVGWVAYEGGTCATRSTWRLRC